ncbi:MAG TPA: hypothetical protein VHM00_06555 [Caldimonas sp.]|jgi:hypothetical protein|nr:hypothetical protein [Caldimonas sp.]HEX2540727.1 hypothetical protein [Caldimonas sp.]
MRAASLVAIVAIVAATAGAGAAASPPGPGRYEAVLCVATQSGAAPSCGSVDVELRSGGRMSVRVADIVYQLSLGRSQLEVATLHGAMQIDEFNAPYEWQGETLRFNDLAKDVRYEVRIGTRVQPR